MSLVAVSRGEVSMDHIQEHGCDPMYFESRPGIKHERIFQSPMTLLTKKICNL